MCPARQKSPIFLREASLCANPAPIGTEAHCDILAVS